VKSSATAAAASRFARIAVSADDLKRETGSVYDAKELLRAKSVATTEAYLHSGVDDLKRAIEKLSSSSPHEQGIRERT
jgi:hypothetical protein